MTTKEIVMTCVRYSSRTEKDHDKSPAVRYWRHVAMFRISSKGHVKRLLSFIASFVLMSHSSVCSTVLEKLRGSFE